MLAIGEHGAATVVLDAQGLIADLAIDSELRDEVEPEVLLAEINQAHARAVREIAARAQPRWATESESRGASASDVLGAPGVAQLLTSLSTGVLPTPREVRNDLGTVTATSMLGSLVSIDCDLGWLGSASESTICDEIVSVARRAAIESDIFGRYAKSGVHDD